MYSNSNGLIRSGRILLATQFTYLLLSSVGLFLWRVQGDPSRGDYTDVLQFAIGLALFTAVWRGWRWGEVAVGNFMRSRRLQGGGHCPKGRQAGRNENCRNFIGGVLRVDCHQCCVFAKHQRLLDRYRMTVNNED